MKVLIACEFSGIVREAFKSKGHDAWSCDFLETEIPGNHIVGNVLDVLDRGWDLMIAHPPCTYLSKVTAPLLKKDLSRYLKMYHAKLFFMKLYNAPIGKICVENPVPLKASELPDYDQIINPNQFGHDMIKRTCLWLRNLPPLLDTMAGGEPKKVFNKKGKSNGTAWYHNSSKEPHWKRRSRTFTGIAEAMADQWS